MLIYCICTQYLVGAPLALVSASIRRGMEVSKWVVETFSLAYESSGQPSPMAVRSHSTRSVAASMALISGVALQEVCDAAVWSSPHTFIRFVFCLLLYLM